MSSLEKMQQLIQEIEERLAQLRDVAGHLQGALEDDQLDERPITAVIPPTYPDEEIVGGSETDDFPDCCAVGNDTYGFSCSGTLIAPTLVVTAAHCSNVTKVFLGGTNVDVPSGGETIKVIASYTHPDLDLRILVLAKEATVPPRHIASPELAAAAQMATVVGFGTIDLQGTVGYGIKRTVRVPITAIDCKDADFAERYGCRSSKEMVAGHRGLLRDSCRGDSGGPLYTQDEDGRYFLLGATSRGARDADHTCGDGGIYIRVDLCVDWIEQSAGIHLS